MSFFDFFHPFYILNVLLCGVYVFIRNHGDSLYLLNVKDSWGYKRETQVITGIATIILIRFVKYFSSWKRFIHEFFFYGKICVFILTILINYKLALWYCFACLSIWLLVKPPKYNGYSNILYIPNVDIFNSLVIKNQSGTKFNYWFVIFYSHYSDDCLYTEELFAKLSIDYYSTNGLKFAKMNVDENPEFVKQFGINIHGYKSVLPYIVLFENGTAKEKYPGLDKEGNALKATSYRDKELIRIFSLDELKRKTA